MLPDWRKALEKAWQRGAPESAPLTLPRRPPSTDSHDEATVASRSRDESPLAAPGLIGSVSVITVSSTLLERARNCEMLALEGMFKELLTDQEFRQASEATEAAGAFAQLGIGDCATQSATVADCATLPGQAPSGERNGSLPYD
jgi:hypothetical protein